MDEEPATDILDATYRALCEQGYADLTLQDIAAEADRSKASIHYHYECKDRLFDAFLEYLYERYSDRVTAVAGDTARERLYALFEALLTDDGDASQREFRTAMLEVKAQAPYDDALQDRLAEFDDLLFEQVREILATGVETGEFDERVDPVLAAEFLATTIQGAHTRQIATGHSPQRLYTTMTRYAETHLLTDDRAEVSR